MDFLSPATSLKLTCGAGDQYWRQEESGGRGGGVERETHVGFD